jgi:alanyl aminopeptidase
LTIIPSDEHFTGRTEIDGTLSAGTDVVWLNAELLDVTSASARSGGQEVPAEPVIGDDQRVALRFPRALPAGPLTLVLAFRGEISARESRGVFRRQSGGEWYAFTHFEPTSARRVFPCVDEPSAKIPWTVTLHVPAGLRAFSNAPLLSQAPEAEGMEAVQFAQTRPIPSYLVAFGVGAFEVLDARPAGSKRIPVRVIAPRGRAPEGAWAARVSPEILESLEDYFGIPYPYEKLDLLALISPSLGAMEHVGLVTFPESQLLAPPEQDSVSRRRGYASVAAHEFAHQWFGDLVTTTWWNDIWLNEAFATWMQTKAIERWAPSWGMRAARVETRDRAAEADTLVNARVVRQRVEGYGDVWNAFDSITYEKGASVLRMFEVWVGEEPFRRGVQRYLRTHADGNATTDDFLAAISASADKDVAPAFGTFLDKPGVPRLRASLSCTRDGAAVLHLAQDRWLPRGSGGDRAANWQLPVCAAWGTGKARRSTCTLLDRPEADLTLDPGNCPSWVLPNAGYAGYYRLQLDGDLRGRLLRAGVLDDAEATGLLGDTRALVDGGAVSVAEGLSLAGRFARAGEHHVSNAAVELATVREDFLSDRLGRAYASWVRGVFGPRARALGFAERPNENDETKLLRPAPVEFVARRGGDRFLIQQARQLAEQWLSRPGSVDAQTMSALMRTAGRFGTADFHRALLDKLERTATRRDRNWLLDGISAARDGALLDENVALAVSGKLDSEEVFKVLTGWGFGRRPRNLPSNTPPLDVEASRSRISAGIDSNWDALTAKDIRGSSLGVFRVVERSCSPEERGSAERLFAPRIPLILGGQRLFAQALERSDLCIVQKSREEAELERFFARPVRGASGAGGKKAPSPETF